jgi:imidazole glycerol-phosphate synthase subunit HisF
MLKKRLVFTLLYDNGAFVLSRNFRLQRVGDLNWLQKNYDFSRVAFFIDELVVLDVSRTSRNPERFCETLRALTYGCFVPIAAGGGVNSLEDAQRLLRNGADKIILNSALADKPWLPKQLAQEFGRQCVVASVDAKKDGGAGYHVCIQNGANTLTASLPEALSWAQEPYIGELYLNSMDKDGTGQGYDFELLDAVAPLCAVPIVMAGGVGNASHLLAGIRDARVDAVATAHLFNFLGDGLERARAHLRENHQPMASWPALAQSGLRRLA